MKATPTAPVETQTIGFAPILKIFFEEAGLQTIIDQNVPLDLRRKILTHGQALVAMVTAILCQVFQMYRLCQFAEKSQILIIYSFLPQSGFVPVMGVNRPTFNLSCCAHRGFAI